MHDETSHNKQLQGKSRDGKKRHTTKTKKKTMKRMKTKRRRKNKEKRKMRGLLGGANQSRVAPGGYPARTLLSPAVSPTPAPLGAWECRGRIRPGAPCRWERRSPKSAAKWRARFGEMPKSGMDLVANRSRGHSAPRRIRLVTPWKTLGCAGMPCATLGKVLERFWASALECAWKPWESLGRPLETLRRS